MDWRWAIVAVILAGPGASAGALEPLRADARGGGRLSASPRTVLEVLVEGARHPDLGWPEFPDFRAPMRRFYVGRDHALAWIRDGLPTEQADAVARALRDAEGKGLVARDYDGPAWAGRLETLRSARAAEPDQVRLDVALTVSLMRYVSDLRVGRMGSSPEEQRVGRMRVVRTDEDGFDVAAFVSERVVSSGDVAAALATAEPPFAAYRRTLEALGHHLELARVLDDGPLPVPRRAVSAGGRYPGAVALARRLRLLGDLTAGADPQGNEGDLYGPPLVDAVARFQRRHGLEASGRLDARTVRELNVPLSRRVEQLAMTLERWRWLPRRFAAPPLIVNIPEFRLHAADPIHGLSMKVVVGRAFRHRTPVFAADMVPVLVVYGTAVVVPDGEVQFFEDIYGHDAALGRALAAESRGRATRVP